MRVIRVIEGQAFDALSESELKKQVPFITVFSRVSPANKLKLIRLLHNQGHVVSNDGGWS